MITRSFRSSFAGPALAVLLLLLAAVPPASAAERTRADIEATYRQDRAACENGSTQQDRKSCLREAGAARAEALQGRLRGPGNPQTWMENALRRCQVHKSEEDRMMCERMVRGDGAVSGSVGGGGILRELQITVPANTQSK